jgi:hypothetical protein
MEGLKLFLAPYRVVLESTNFNNLSKLQKLVNRLWYEKKAGVTNLTQPFAYCKAQFIFVA